MSLAGKCIKTVIHVISIQLGLPELLEVLPFGGSPFLLVLKNHCWTGIQLHIFLLSLLILKFAGLDDRLSLKGFQAASWL